MCERICKNCTKFKVDKRGIPEGVKDLSKKILWNEDGTEKEKISPLAFVFALQTSGAVEYGHRGCEESFPSSALSSAPCIHPESFEPKE